MRYLVPFFLVIPLLCFGQQTDTVDYLKIEARVALEPSEEKIRGNVTVTFQPLADTDSIFMDAVNMRIVPMETEGISFYSSDKKIWFLGDFRTQKEYKLSFSYEAQPKQTLYFTGDQVWTQGQGKYTSHWLPSIDDMNDKIEFDITVENPQGLTVISNGKQEVSDTKLVHFNMNHPMSSYLVALVQGDFVKNTITSSTGIPIELYLSSKDSMKFEPTFRYTKQIFDFFEAEIGLPYPWQNYKQIPVRDFLYAGMENTTATIFSEAFVVDAIGFNDRNYVNVNAHELAHQWFGNLVTETESTHHWLHEGFASYYALLAEKQIFGDDYYYWKLSQSAEQLRSLSDEGKGEALLNPKASSLTFYEKGAWALHILKELIGPEAFKTAVKNYLEKHKFKNVTTEDFLREVRNSTSEDISQWEADWLVQSAFKVDQAFQSLKKSEFLAQYFQIQNLRKMSLAEKKDALLSSPAPFENDYIGQEIVYQLAEQPLPQTRRLYESAFASGNLYVRQAIALSLSQVPEVLREQYESLLNDDSYVTQEAALYNLWTSFPEHRMRYLDEMKTRVGFQDRNVRQLWLVLALYTDGYKNSAKPIFAKELKSYSSATYSFEIRQKALEYIHSTNLYDTQILKNVVNAAAHHNWRFRSFARELLAELLKNETYGQRLKELLPTFTKREQQILKSKMDER